MKKTIMKKVAVSVEKIALRGVGRRCIGAWHQPKVPAALRKKKEK
ncbi:MAG: cyclic lactone autoinducer peptide [Oscillospiraceae bacterium]|nr:cyclic lactone autoinducer peptide [Oscillospiraceae bacterium]